MIFWNTCRAKDRYRIYSVDTVYGENLTFDEMYALWKKLRGI